MDKIRLKKVIDSCGMNSDELYNKINLIDKENTYFDSNSYIDLVLYSIYMFHVNYGIDKLSKNGFIPNIISNVSSFEQLKKELNKYKEIEFNNSALPDETNLYQEICRLASLKLFSKDFDWTRIYSTKMYNNGIDIMGKLYISIDNKDLYQFANLMLTNCLESGVKDFEFKVNNNESVNRADNAVIFFTEKNLPKYLEIINRLKEEHPEFTINPSQMLGIELSSGVVIAMDYMDGTSFTDKICKSIIKLKEKNYSTEDIINIVDIDVTKHLEPVINILNNSIDNVKTI